MHGTQVEQVHRWALLVQPPGTSGWGPLSPIGACVIGVIKCV